MKPRHFLWIVSSAFLLLQTPLRGLAAEEALISQVKHSPEQPHATEVVKITAKVNIPNGIKSVTLSYQTVDPGKYIALRDADYKKQWVTLPMVDDGQNGDAVAGDGVYTLQIPAELQKHRRLIRYRISAATSQGKTVTTPAADDAQPNFAYFVYNGVPAWSGAIEPNGRDPKKRTEVLYGTNVMRQVQAYHLIGKSKEIEGATWYEQSQGKDYKYTGTLVADGKVYDHVRYRARGGSWRYAMGKNMWKVDFNSGHHLQAKDDYGQKYKTKWGKLNLRACIQQGDYGHRGEQGMFESVGFRLFNLVGVESPDTHWVEWRIISGEEENPSNQYQGDFWGLYLAIENEDGHFLEEHGLPKGNLYKMMFGQGELQSEQDKSPKDGADLQQFLMGLRRRSSEAWWRANVDLPRYYSYRSIMELIHHYDTEAGKNYDFYHNPKTGKWIQIPWDIDLTWADNMYGEGNEPFYRWVASYPSLMLEYQNRVREIRDLLYNSDQANQLIDECAAIISDPGGASSIVDADRAKWDFHPIMNSRYAMSGKARQGLFYHASRNGAFSGMVQLMKDYVKRRSAYVDRELLNDPSIPNTPVLVATDPGLPANHLTFKTSEFSGSGRFLAMKWRLGEVTPVKDASAKPAQRGKYEITPVWESASLTNFVNEMTIPAETIKAGHTYRARVRMQDNTGRWSHWSQPVQFVAAPPK